MEISKVGVVGCGLMGHGIAQICAQAGWDVVVREVNQDRLDGGIGKIEKQLARAVEKGRASSRRTPTRSARRIEPTLDYGDLADCDLVIEAITEDLGAKLEMWSEVDELVKDDAFFATNTSSLAVDRPGRLDLAPGPVLRAALLQPGAGDAAAGGRPDGDDQRRDAEDRGFEVGEKLGKTTVHAKDKTGFIVNRLLVPYMLDAIRAYEEGVGTVDQIDTAMKAGANHPMGPFTLARLRRPGHDQVDRRRHVRRVPRAPLRRPADPSEDGRGRLLRAQVRQGFLRLLRGRARSHRARSIVGVRLAAV